MARWYARFDSGGLNGANWNSGYAPTDLAYREYRRIGLAFGAGDRFRNGLIASRSALSAEAYDDLTGIYRNGGFGVIAPGDLYSSNLSSFVSFSAVYTSSLTNPPAPGIITPSDYATRPTASVLSTDSRLGAVRSDGVGVSYNAYISASNAVTDTLNAVQDGAGTAFTPYTRPGQNRSRTLHSIYHDPDLQYYAWDDFTPGTPQSFTYDFPARTGLYEIFLEPGDPLWLVFQWQPEYKADRLGNAEITVRTDRVEGGPITVETIPITSSTGNLYYSASLTALSYGTPATGYDYDIYASIRFRDAIITQNTGSLATSNQPSFVRIYKVYPVSVIGPYDYGTSACTGSLSNSYYSDGALSISPPMQLYSDKTGTAAPAGAYRNPLDQTVYYEWDGGAFTPYGGGGYGFPCP